MESDSKPSALTMDKLVALAKNRGFIYPGSEIYGGLANAWDYGPLGVELKNNVKRAWWKKFVQENEHNVGVDCAILMNPQVWVASGHVGGFTDPLIDCRACKTRGRADQIIEAWLAGEEQKSRPELAGLRVDGWGNDELSAFIQKNKVPCLSCGASDFTDVRKFNMMFKTFQGVTEDSQAQIYLRPETAQGIFVNFRNVLRTTRRKIPFGIAQVGKAFRNEITPGNFVFRTREFEQMELEFFCEPGTDLEWFAYWKDFCRDWLLSLGMSEGNMRLRDHTDQELSFYSKATTDIEYRFPFGWGELWGIADRTDYDLRCHSEESKDDLSYYDQDKDAKYVPFCIEPSLGADRMALALLCDAYGEEELAPGDSRIVLRLHPAIAPVKAAILPLSKKLAEPSREIYKELLRSFPCDYDDSGSIGKRYRRQDEIGTPFCVTFDFDSLEDRKATIRERDSMDQIRMPIEGLAGWLSDKLAF